MSRKLDILAMVTDGFGASGGIARYNCDLISALASHGGHAIHVLPRFGTPSAAVPAGVSQSAAYPSLKRWALACARAATARRADVLFCGHINAVPLVAALARAVRKPLWVQVHGFEAWTDRGAAIRWGMEQASLVTSVSRYTRRRLLEWTGLDQSRVRVLPNTFSSSFVPRSPPSGLIAKLGLQGRKVILTVGRIDAREQYKGHDRIIRLLPKILAEDAAAHYVIAGSGSDVQRLEDLAAQHGVTGRVTFTGQVPADELADYFRLATVFAMPSTGEGFGIVFLEAAASGLHVIGGNRDGSLDALADGEIGRAVDPDDEAMLLSAIVGGLQQQQRIAPPALSRFSFGNFAAHANGLVEAMIAGSSNKPGTQRP